MKRVVGCRHHRQGGGDDGGDDECGFEFIHDSSFQIFMVEVSELRVGIFMHLEFRSKIYVYVPAAYCCDW